MYYASGHYLDNRNPTSTESDVLPADTFTDMMVYKARYGGYQDTTPWPWMSFTSVDRNGEAEEREIKCAVNGTDYAEPSIFIILCFSCPVLQLGT